MPYARILVVLGAIAFAWSRLEGPPGLGLVGLVMVTLAIYLSLRSSRLGRRISGSSSSTKSKRSRPARRGASLPPPRFDVEELARRLGVPADELGAARAAYARFAIAKRGGGTRQILAPDRATKALQRRILQRLLGRLPVHPSAHGFERGRSIVSNASPHVGRPVVLRLDVHDFFASTSTRRIRRLYRVLGWDREAAKILTRLTTLDGGLPQGAPTSPRLANLVNVQLDARLAGLARALGATYTRYADDLTFSFEVDDTAEIHDVIRASKRFLAREGYRLHEGRKLRIRRRHERQLVTGLVVNQRAALPRARRRWLRAVEHHVRVGRPATLTEDQLRGWRAFELMVEAPVTEDVPRVRGDVSRLTNQEGVEQYGAAMAAFDLERLLSCVTPTGWSSGRSRASGSTAPRRSRRSSATTPVAAEDRGHPDRGCGGSLGRHARQHRAEGGRQRRLLVGGVAGDLPERRGLLRHHAMELRDGLVYHETTYWAAPFEAPDWRAPWVSRA